MKEVILTKEGLTREPQTPYSSGRPLNRGGDIYMAGESGGENMSQNQKDFILAKEGDRVNEATRRMEKVAREREEKNNPSVKKEDSLEKLTKAIEDLPVALRKAMLDLAAERAQNTPTPVVSASGSGQGGGEKPPAPPNSENSMPEEPENNPPGEEAGPDIKDIKDPTIKKHLNRISTLIDAGLPAEGVLRSALEDIIKLQDVSDRDLKIAIGKLQRELAPFEKARMAERNARPEGFWMKLKPEDFIMLRKGDIEEWVNKQYDILYTGTQGTRVAESTLLSDAQAGYSEATLYLSKILQKPEQIAELRNYFETRLNLIVMSSTISTKNIEQAQNAAGRLLATGLLHANSLDGGKVGSMFNRACELLEDMRLRGDRGHVTPTMWEDLRKNLINQQVELVEKGIGDFVLSDRDKEKYQESMGDEEFEKFSKLTEEDKKRALEVQTEKNITRSVNTALDIVVSSQRLHIIAARGKELFGNKSFFSDAGGAFRVFNLETFHAYKWQLYSTHDVKMNNLVKESLINEWVEGKVEALEKEEKAHQEGKEYTLTIQQIKDAKELLELRKKHKEKEQLGDNLLKEMSTVNDFFNAGWRIEGMLDQLDTYFAHLEARKVSDKEWKSLSGSDQKKFEEIGKKTASNFGLFFRLKAPRENFDGDKRGEVWEKIIKYRPEEVVRLLRDRLSELDPKLNDAYKKIFTEPNIKNYDEFKEKFGSAIRAIREKGMKNEILLQDGTKLADPLQIDFANLEKDSEYWKDLDKATDGNAQTILNTYKRMQDYARQNYIKTEEGNKKIITFEWDPRFSDIYNRVLNADDALLGKLEDAPKDFEDMTPLSKIWSADIGGDILVRNFNDIAAGQRAVTEYMKFIEGHSEKDKLEAAEKCASAYAEPNGLEARARVLRHTYISFLEASILPEFLQALGIKHLPFRMPATVIQGIYGPQMEGFSLEELQDKRDHIRGLMIGSADQVRKEAEIEIEKIRHSSDSKEKKDKLEAKQHEKIEKAEEKAHKQEGALNNMLKVNPKDIVRLKAYNILFSLLAFILAETIEVTGIKELAKIK